MTEYALDLYPRDDPRDGTRLVRYTYEDLIAAEYRDVIGVGAGQATMWADHAGVEQVDSRGEQYIRVVRLGGGEAVVGGFWTSKMPFETAIASERRHLTISGPGQMAYLARARMAPHTYISPIFTGQDPFDGMWRLSAQSTAFANGPYLGAMLWRVIYEAQHFTPGSHKHADGIIVTDTHADDRLVSRIPDLVLGFDQFEDSDGNAWTLTAGEFSAQIGENVLGVVQRLMQAGLSLWMDPNTFTLYAWEGRPATKLGRSTDRTGAAWGASVVRFAYPTDGTTATGNVLSETTRVVNAYLPQGPIWVGGNDVYHKETGAADALYEGYVHSTAEDLTALAALGAAQSTAREEAADVGQLKHRLGDDPTNGAYLPGEHYRLDELVRVNTGSGEFDYDEDDYPVGAWRVSLPEGGAEWVAHADLGASYEEARAREFSVAPSAGHTHPPNPRLCRDTTTFAFSSPIELLMKFRFRMGTTTQRHLLQFALYKFAGSGFPNLNINIENHAGGGWSDQLGISDLTLGDLAGNSTDAPSTAGILTTVDDVWCWVRMVAGPTQIMARLWKDGSAEPGTWDVESDDADVNFNTAGAENIDRIETHWNGGNAGSSLEIESYQFVQGFTGLSDTETFTRTVALGVGISEINGVMHGGRTASLSVNGTQLIDTNPLSGAGGSGSGWTLAIDQDSGTCIHGGAEATSGVASVACGKCAAPGNHEHDYVASGGAIGQALIKASDDDWDTEWGTGGVTDHGALTGLADDDHPQYATNAEFDNHDARHANGGADEVAVEGLGTAETDTALVLHPDGTGGIEWGTDEGAGGGIAGELVTDTIIGDGVEDTFALSVAPTGTWALVSTNGADLLPTEYAIVAGDIVFDVAPVNLSEVLVTFIAGGFTVPATDPGDIADPTLASAEDVANKVNDLMAELRTAGIIA